MVKIKNKKTVYCKIFGKEQKVLPPDHPMYCCPNFQAFFLYSLDMPIAYDAQQRMYCCITPKHEANVCILRCPLCGKKFPKNLCKEFYKELSKIVGRKITYTYTEYDWNTLPEEFKSEEWWRKRGL